MSLLLDFGRRGATQAFRAVVTSFDGGLGGEGEPPPPPPPPPIYIEVLPYVRPLFAWRAGDGTIIPHDGSEGTFTRAGTATAIDTRGATRTCVYNQPRFEWVDVTGDGVRDVPVLLLGGAAQAEVLSYPFNALPDVMGTIYVCFVERGGIGLSNGTICAIADAPHNAPSCRLYRHASGFYCFEHRTTAATTVTAIATVAPTLGQVVELHAMLAADGSVQLGQAIEGGAEVIGDPTTPLAKAPTWSGPLLWIGSVDGAAPTQIGLRSLTIAAGVRALADMRPSVLVT